MNKWLKRLNLLHPDMIIMCTYLWLIWFVVVVILVSMCIYLWWSFLCLFFRWAGVYFFFPKGNNVDYLSMYLEVADSASLPYGWSIYAQFSLTVVNQIMNKYSVRKGSPFSLFLTVVTNDLSLNFLFFFCPGNTTVLLICDCPNSLRRGYEDGLDSKRLVHSFLISKWCLTILSAYH
jgi:hypothetical protein